MAEITLFVALPFDFDDGGPALLAGEPIDLPEPCRRDTACARALGRYFGHAVL